MRDGRISLRVVAVVVGIVLIVIVVVVVAVVIVVVVFVVVVVVSVQIQYSQHHFFIRHNHFVLYIRTRTSLQHMQLQPSQSAFMTRKSNMQIVLEFFCGHWS